MEGQLLQRVSTKSSVAVLQGSLSEKPADPSVRGHVTLLTISAENHFFSACSAPPPLKYTLGEKTCLRIFSFKLLRLCRADPRGFPEGSSTRGGEEAWEGKGRSQGEGERNRKKRFSTDLPEKAKT